ncbi:MAG: Rrf2 family transcriptional regulator, partial [Proteobacteria bacterium]|nr:Rrf2 family transcriptional regulator [Pseudomonadota bacterium]
VDSARGPGGGYRLSRLADDIAVAEIIAAVDETVDATRCRRKGNCQHEERCLTHDLWCDLSDQIFSFLSEISLASLVEKKAVQEVSMRQDNNVLLDNRKIA